MQAAIKRICGTRFAAGLVLALALVIYAAMQYRYLTTDGNTDAAYALHLFGLDVRAHHPEIAGYAMVSDIYMVGRRAYAIEFEAKVGGQNRRMYAVVDAGTGRVEMRER